ncbi:MAG: hypothetical protein LBN95_07030 [Prevotellaceae bacterium]|jgi:hypothetical protein|nr:hypothetical protein [Prevotellaceae bacterium]
MALQKEIWITSIIGLLFANNSFAARAIDHSEFADNKTVHVPNAADTEAARKTRLRSAGDKNLALEVSDTDLTYNIEQYFVGPYVIPKLEEVELSYNKRESLVQRITEKVRQALFSDLLTKWLPATPTKIATSGDSVAATAPSATGNRNAMSKNDVLEIKKKFDKWDISQEGRCILLDADMYNQLLNDLTTNESSAFLATADAAKGIVGKLYGFDFYERSTVYITAAGGTIKTGAAAATDCVAGLAWSDKCVSRAVGEIELYDNPGDATEFGDVISVDVRAGGSIIRSDGKGVLIIYQGTPA